MLIVLISFINQSIGEPVDLLFLFISHIIDELTVIYRFYFEFDFINEWDSIFALKVVIFFFPIVFCFLTVEVLSFELILLITGLFIKLFSLVFKQADELFISICMKLKFSFLFIESKDQLLKFFGFSSVYAYSSFLVFEAALLTLHLIY